MRLGPLRHRITLQRRATDVDDFGQQVSGWDDVATLWASVEPISGRELLAAQQVQGEISHRIRCRFIDGVTAATRILFGSRVFDIQAPINPREVGALLEILAKEGPTDG